MSRIAVDTNVLLYALDNFYPEKQQIALQIIANRPFFCSQSLSEFTNVCLRRWKYSKSKTADSIKVYLRRCNYVPLDEATVIVAFDIMERYDLQLFDAMIIAGALDSDCDILYSEDMSDGLIINQRLKIVNPFKQPTPP